MVIVLSRILVSRFEGISIVYTILAFPGPHGLGIEHNTGNACQVLEGKIHFIGNRPEWIPILAFINGVIFEQNFPPANRAPSR